MTQETVNLDVFTLPPGPILPVIPRHAVDTPPAALTRQSSTSFISELQIGHSAALRSADFATPTQIEHPHNPTHAALPAPCGPHGSKASRARLIQKLDPKLKYDSLT